MTPVVKKWYFGLALKYILHLAAVGLLLSVLLIWNAMYQQERSILREMEQRGRLLGESLSNSCSLPYLLGDMDAIQYILSRSYEIQDVIAITLTDAEGHVDIKIGEQGTKEVLNRIVDFNELSVWKEYGVFNVVNPMSIQRQGSEEGVTDLLFEMDASDPEESKSDILGYIYVTLSLERSRQFLRGFIYRSLGATIAIIIIASIMAFLFYRKTILRPIQKLVGAMSSVREGNVNTSLEKVVEKDEIGALTNAYSDMMQNLLKAEEELRLANRDLQNRVNERTMDLAQALKNLEDAQEKLVRTEKLAAIGQLASGVGHDLRNPLGSIRNAIYYIRDSLKGSAVLAEDPSMIEFLDLAEVEIANSTRIIGDLLEFTRVKKIIVHPTNINNLLDSMKKILEIPENIKLIKDYARDLPDIRIDFQRIRQVFVNIAMNAIEAMPDGGELRITTIFENNPGNSNSHILISFQDTGVGMSEEVARKSFDPLFTTKNKGTGLGLAVSLEIVEAHGGKITIEGEPQKGCTFIVKLPLSGSDDVSNPPST